MFDLAQRNSVEAVESDAASTLGRLPPLAVSKQAMRQFQLLDTQICVPPLQWGEKQDWFAFITPKSRAYVTERDFVQLETFQRENLTVLSSMDAFVSSVAGVLKGRPHEDHFLIRTLYGIDNGLAEIIKRSLASLQQIVLHHRDMPLWYSSLCSKHVAYLRHAPVLGATLVFPPDLVHEVLESCQGDIKSKAFFKAPLREPLLQSSLLPSAVLPVSRNVSRGVRTRFGRPSGRAHRVLRKMPTRLPRSTRQAATPGKPKGQTNRSWRQELSFVFLPIRQSSRTPHWKAGIVCQGQSWGGRWQRQGQHINWLELRTVLIALQLLQFMLRNKPVLFLIDNSTAVSHLKKQGRTRSQSLLKLTTRILQLAHDLGIQILPRHITGQLNVLADLASRSGQIVPSEWALSPQAFQWVVSQSPWGPPQVDLFAIAMNHRLHRYFSPCPDPEALAIDALRSDWPNEVLYSFPPACMLFQFLQRYQENTDQNILLVLQWSPQARWVPLLNSLCAKPCLCFPLWQGASASASLGLPSSGSASATPSTVVSRRQRMKDQGFSDRVVDRIEKSRALSTKAHYKSQWDLFVSWATDKGLNPLQASLPLLTDFLQYLFKVRQISVRTIKNYKSAISFYYMSSPAGDIYRSWFRVCPSVRSYVTLPLSGPYLLES